MTTIAGTVQAFFTDYLLLAAPDLRTKTGRRDHALLHVAIETGLMASELTGLTCRDIQLDAGAHVHCPGKGRKDRITPLTPSAIRTAFCSVATPRPAGSPRSPRPAARGGHRR